MHSGISDERDRFMTLTVELRARNNLRADLQAEANDLLGTIAPDTAVLPNDKPEPLHECRLVAQPRGFELATQLL